MRKSGYNSTITESLRKKIKLTRYQSTLYTMHYSDYVSYVKAARGAAPSIVGSKFGNHWFSQTAFSKTTKLVWSEQKHLFSWKIIWVGIDLPVISTQRLLLVIYLTCLYHSSNSFDFEERNWKPQAELRFLCLSYHHKHWWSCSFSWKLYYVEVDLWLIIILDYLLLCSHLYQFASENLLL